MAAVAFVECDRLPLFVAPFIADTAGLATSLHIACRWAEVLGRFAVDPLRFKAAMINAGSVAVTLKGAVLMMRPLLAPLCKLVGAVPVPRLLAETLAR